MTTITDRVPVYDVIAYMLSNSQISNALQYSGTGNTPFFPAQELPESNVPYVVYNTSSMNDANTWWMNWEEANFMIFTARVRESALVMNVARDLFQRGSDSAREINRWMREQGRPLDFKYHSFEFAGGGSLTPTSEEGGAKGRLMSIRYSYTPTSGTGIA